MNLSDKALSALNRYRDDRPDFELPIEEPVKRKRAISTGVVSLVAYLIGVNEEHFGKEYQRSVFEDMEKNRCARIIRSLCAIRAALLRSPGTIKSKLDEGMSNLDTIPELIDTQFFEYLNGENIRIVNGTKIKKIDEYVISINSHISNNIGNALYLFPSWVNKEYIKDVIVMPNGSKSKNVQSVIDTIKDNFDSYPFHCYVNWPLGRADAFVEDPENYAEVVRTGNIILNDKKFLVLLYRVHDDAFVDFDRVTDADEETKERLASFMTGDAPITMLVDCENSDPYKLCAVFQFLREQKRQTPDLHGMDKIILFDDSHTVDAWDILSDYVSTPIVHEEVGRVVGHKSLVDIAMTAGTCKEYYEAGTRRFIIASSDSDFWGMMHSLPEASFFVLAEASKFGKDAERFYTNNGIPSCLMDDFAMNMTKIKEGALKHGLAKKISNLMTMNLHDLLEDLTEDLRLDMSLNEREIFYNDVSKKLKMVVDENGTLSVNVM